MEIAGGELSGAADALSREKESVEKFLQEHVAMGYEDSLSASQEADAMMSGLEPTADLTPTVAECALDKARDSPTETLSPEAPFTPGHEPVPKPRSTAAKSAPKSAPKRRATAQENCDPNLAATNTEKKPDGKALAADYLEPTDTSEKRAKVPRKKRNAMAAETVEKAPSGSSAKPATRKAKRAKKDSDKGAEDDKRDNDKTDGAVPTDAAPELPTEECPEEMEEEEPEDKKDEKVYADGWTDEFLKKKLHSVP